MTFGTKDENEQRKRIGNGYVEAVGGPEAEE